MAPLGPFGAPPPVAVGVSGGPHSLALALLARDWAAARGGSVLGLVVDHGLRPESEAEAREVAATLAAQGIASRILALGLPPGARMQERAREARFAALLDACRAEGRPWLLLGHHRGDQAETLLFRALRASGEAGLAGMARSRMAGPALVLRPLLDVPAARLEAVCAAAGLNPVRDPSNRDRRFARIRLRQAIAALPDPDAAEAALARAAAAFARRRAARERAIAARLAAAAAFLPDGAVRLSPDALGRDAVAAAVLARLIRLLGEAAHAPPPAAVRALLDRGQGTLGRCWLRPAAGGTWMLRRDPGAGAQADAVPLVPAKGLHYGGPWFRPGYWPRGGPVT